MTGPFRVVGWGSAVVNAFGVFHCSNRKVNVVLFLLTRLTPSKALPPAVSQAQPPHVDLTARSEADGRLFTTIFVTAICSSSLATSEDRHGSESKIEGARAQNPAENLHTARLNVHVEKHGRA